jgi:hypothetical protein
MTMTSRFGKSSSAARPAARAEGTLIEDHPVNVGGSYLFEERSAGEYTIRATLGGLQRGCVRSALCRGPRGPGLILVHHTQDASGLPQNLEVDVADSPALTTTNVPLDARHDWTTSRTSISGCGSTWNG